MTALACLWMGVLASLGPCALGPSLAALVYLAGGESRPRHLMSLVVPWAFGRFAVFTTLAVLALVGLFTWTGLADWVQTHGVRMIGPSYLLCGLFLLNLMPWNWDGGRLTAHALTRTPGPRSPALFSLSLGALSAIAFCPASAALFFTGLLPLATRDHSTFLYPISFAVGTLLPILLFSLVLRLGLGAAGRLFGFTRVLERYSRRVTGAVFLVVGGWESWRSLIRPLL